MKISLNWQQKYSNVDIKAIGIDQLVEKIGSQLGAIEAVEDLAKKYQGIIVVKVLKCDKHPNADKLSVCMIDDGGVAEGVTRDNEGHVQVVCGAPNVHADMLAVWIPPGVTVPATADKDPFVLEARDIRGTVSNGMLASAHELAFSDDHTGILEVDVENARPGQSLVEAFQLDDHIIDIENKMFTHRPDLFGQLGVAREIAGITHQKFESPDWYKTPLEIPASNNSLPLEVKNELAEQVPRFMAVTIGEVDVKPSPQWLQSLLTRVGVRPINNIVDLTNYYMLLTAQPLHAYDYDKVKEDGQSAEIVVRFPREGEKLELLNGKELEPRQEAIMIANANMLIGVGGVMGGADTEVDEHTKNIILECATFDMYSIRKTAMTHGLFTDAVTRFTKGQSPLQNDRVLAKTVEDILELAGGQVASAVQDDNHANAAPQTVTEKSDFVNSRLGLSMSDEEMKTLLENVEFTVALENGQLQVTAPFWRTDIEAPEDVVEEVGRLHGYDNVPMQLPKRTLKPAPRDPMLTFKSRLRHQLRQSGANEVLTYSFVHGDLIDKAGQDKTKAFKLANAISPQLQYYRLSLTPSLLDKVHPNIKAGFDEFVLFELNKTHQKDHIEGDGSPEEQNVLALVYAAEPKQAAIDYQGAPFYMARKYLHELIQPLTKQTRYVSLKEYASNGKPLTEWLKPFDENRSAVILLDDKILGVVGEYKPSVRRSLKLPETCAGFEINLHNIYHSLPSLSAYVALPKYPRAEQDISLKVSAATAYADVYNVIRRAIQDKQPPRCLSSLEPVDIYQPKENGDIKHITLRLSIASYERTLTTEEINDLLNQVAAVAKSALGAERL